MPDAIGRAIDAAYLRALNHGPQRVLAPIHGPRGIPLPVASRLAATGRVLVQEDVCYAA